MQTPFRIDIDHGARGTIPNNDTSRSIAMHRAPSRETPAVQTATPTKTFHRLRAARRAAGLSLRDMAKRMNVSVTTVRAEEESDRDLRLADLQRWQRALQLPLTELLESPASHLAEPTRHRARIFRLAKTASALLDKCTQETNRILASRMLDQLHELMPELRELVVTQADSPQTRDERGRAEVAPPTYGWMLNTSEDGVYGTLPSGSLT